MSILTPNPRTDARDATAFRATVAAPAALSRREHRERDFGVGYGSSSGYASQRRYASNWGETRFRCS